MTSFVQITDLHIDNLNAQLQHIDARRNALVVLDALQDQDIEGILITGDVAESRTGLDWFFEQIDKRNLTYFFVPGNHDDKEYLEKIQRIKSPQSYYCMEREGFLLLFLDSGKGFMDEEQLAWVHERIHATSSTILICNHYPILDCGDTFMDKYFSLMNRDAVLDILTGVRNNIVLFCGHYHWEQIVEYKNIIQYVTPSTFYQLKKFSDEAQIEHEDIGYRILRLDNGALETTVNYIEKSNVSPG